MHYALLTLHDGPVVTCFPSEIKDLRGGLDLKASVDILRFVLRAGRLKRYSIRPKVLLFGFFYTLYEEEKAKNIISQY